MIKVFLVEDEYVVREGIKNNVDWKGHGYDFVGEAGDGELAFPMIQKLKPDLVITDIRMPFMDGLELSKLIKKEFPWMEIIILSGFEEFEYAKQGIKIGVAQYLTKPIKGDDLLKEVDIVAARIEENKREKQIREKYKKEMEESTVRERSDFFNYLVTGEKSLSELMELANKLSIDLTAMYYNVLLFSMNVSDRTPSEFSQRILEIEKTIDELQKKYDFILFDRHLEGKAVLFKADSLEQLEELENNFRNDFIDILKKYPGIRYFGGIGERVNRIRSLPDSFKAANHAFAHRYFTSDSDIINNPSSIDKKPQDMIDYKSIDPKQIDRTRITNFLKMGSTDEVSLYVEEFLEGIGRDSLESSMFRQYIAMDCYFSVAAFCESLDYDKNAIQTPDVFLSSRDDDRVLSEYLINIVEKAIELRDNKTSSRYGEMVDEVLAFIAENYSDEDISLNQLASHVNVSPNHLSMIFSQETGNTFIKYLTDYRMNKAKELLKCTNKRGAEIALEVGYKDPHYFSYIFKKTQGMTPTQFREGEA